MSEKRKPKTIQLFLPTGKPQGLKLAHITSRIPIALYFPRADFADACSRSEFKRSGIYFLFGDRDDGKIPVYIGESENCLDRLKNHNRKKFWQSAVVIVSRAEDTLTKCQIKFLEWYCCKEISRIGRGKLVNDRPPSIEPFVTESVRADMMEMFETISLLLSTLDYSIFEELCRQDSIHLRCERRGAKAFGQLVEGGFLVLEGSIIPLSVTPSFGGNLKEKREMLLKEGILSLNGDYLVFTSDYFFTSPSRAASIVIGSSANGWVEWKDSNGKTLDELLRSKIEGQEKTIQTS